MATPKPVKLTQVDAASYDGAFEPEPLIVVGPIPGGGGGGGGAVASVNGKTGDVVLSAADVGAATSAQGALAATAVQPAGLTKAAVGLGSVDNTSDANKPVSTAQAAAINAKVGSGNASVTGIEYYPTVGDLPNPGVTGVIYATDSA